MLQTGNQTALSSASSGEVGSVEDLLNSLRGLLTRQLPLIASIFIVVLGLGTVYYLTTPKRYTGTASLIIDSKKTQLMQQQSPLGLDVPVDSATVDSQVEILKSENIALAVIKDLHLVEEPEFGNKEGGVLSSLFSLVPGFEREPLSDYERSRKALGIFDKRLVIKRVGLTYVIEISFSSTDPERAARIANSVADAYIVDSLESKYQASRRAASWLQDRLKELRAQASAAERAVVDYKAKNNIVDTGGRLLSEQQLAEMNSTLSVAKAQRAEAQARVERISSILASANPDSGTLVNDVATVADTLRNDVIIRLRQQYLDLANREADWAARYGQSHLAVVNLRNQMREIRRSISDELRRIAETYKSDLEIAKNREETLQKSLNESIAQSNDTSQAQIVLRELESSAQSYRALADNFLQLYMVSIQQQSFPMTESRLITQASRPLESSFPKLLIVFAIALGGGAILALGAAVLRDLADRVFRTEDQVERTLAADCLAVIPLVASRETKPKVGLLGNAARLLPGRSVPDRVTQKGTPAASSPSSAANSASASDRMIAYSSDVQRYVLDAPFSRFSEALRSIKLATDLNDLHVKVKSIGITSSLPNEGKSTIAISLAQLLAHSGERTILVDCDLRNPSLTHRLAPNAEVGLLEVMLGQADYKEVLWHDPDVGLSFLPTVVKNRLPHSSEVLSSAALEALFRELRESYDRVIVDLSPLAPIVDVRATRKIVDSYLLVVEWGATKIDVVEKVLGNASLVREKLLGVVLNKANMAALSRYEAHRGSYYNNQYYSRYGYGE